MSVQSHARSKGCGENVTENEGYTDPSENGLTRTAGWVHSPITVILIDQLSKYTVTGHVAPDEYSCGLRRGHLLRTTGIGTNRTADSNRTLTKGPG